MSSFMPADSVKVPKRARLETEEDDMDEEEHDGGNEDEGNRKSKKAMHGAIVDYLKSLDRDQQATVEDIKKELRINLNKQQYVLDMIKSNPKVEVERRYIDDMLFFKYRSKFEIKDKAELLREIERVASGISMKEICNPPCYNGIEADCHSMIVGGTIIAVKNKEFKAVLFPRGQPFFTRLSGEIVATPGLSDLETTADLRAEIRRGDAIRVGLSGDWYRVSSAAPSGRELDRQTAPLSVTSERAMSDKNIYRDVFDAKSLPLDGDFEAYEDEEGGHGVFKGGAYRHGAANNIRQLWGSTMSDMNKIAFRANNPETNALALRRELVKLKLISTSTSTVAGADAKRSLQRVRNREKVRKKRKHSDRAGTKSFNEHLKGSHLEDVMRKTTVS